MARARISSKWSIERNSSGSWDRRIYLLLMRMNRGIDHFRLSEPYLKKILIFC